MRYKGDAPFFQCKVSLDWSTSMTEVDSLGLIVTDVCVPPSAPRL